MKRLLQQLARGSNHSGMGSREKSDLDASQSSVGIVEGSSNDDVAFMGEFHSLDLATPSSTTQEVVIPNLEYILNKFEERVKAETHRYHLTAYHNCFIGSQAVDVLVELERCSRSYAVKIGQALQREYRLFEHVTSDHLFQDAYLYFRYVPTEERTAPITPDQAKTMTLVEIAAALEKGVVVLNRRYRLKIYKETFVGSEVVDFLVKSGFVVTRREAVRLGRILFKELNLFEHSAQEKPFEDDYLFYRFTNKSQRRQPSSTLTAAQALSSSNGQNSLLNAAMALEYGVRIRDHKWRGKSYADTFIASQAVDFIVHSSLANTRREAVQLGRQMAQEFHWFEHVAGGNHEFSDDYLFFRFTDEYDRRYPGQVPSSPMTTEQLKDIAEKLRRSIKVGTHRYHARLYPDTFIATEAVDFLSAYTDSRRQAVKLGRKIVKLFGTFRHVTGDHELKDEYLFFRFCDASLDDVERAVKSAKRSLPDIARALRQGVQVSTHRYHLKSYKDTFLGSEAVDFLEQFCANRQDALLIGRRLHNEYNLYDHVTKDHELKDEGLFYRFNKDNEITGGLSLIQLDMDTATLRNIAKDLEANIEVKDHRFHMRVYKDTFIGSDAVDYLIKVCKSREEAVEVGRALARTFNLLEHVTRDHDFSDERYFFRFVKPSLRRFWVEVDDEAEVVVSIPDDWDLTRTPSEILWHSKVKAFEEKVLLKSAEKQKLAQERRTLVLVAEGSWGREILRAASVEWMSTFRKVDPRYQILKFFTEISQAGADEIEEKGLETKNISILSKFFHKSSVFTVWRPTSYEAIKKMMTGEAVGKGLDIKGKSAKRGKLSAFVPFLQISENTHKSMVKKLSKHATVRLFFSRNARGDRDTAAENLEAVAEEMVKAVEEAKTKLAEKDIDGDTRKVANEMLLLDLGDPSITYVDDYSPDVFGIEIPLRLFWEAYIVRQDITREPDSIYDTGRPSQPAFQDMNIGALQAKAKEGNPRAVLYQNSDAGDPMNPFELLMAYEEDEYVKPVVSDFDCLLVGTRAVPFQKPLPPDQINTLKWCVDEIQGILDSPPSEKNWTSRWLEVLKAATMNGFHPEFPRFGFGGEWSPVAPHFIVDRDLIPNQLTASFNVLWTFGC